MNSFLFSFKFLFPSRWLQCVQQVILGHLLDTCVRVYSDLLYFTEDWGPCRGQEALQERRGAHRLPATSSQAPEPQNNPAWDSNLPSLQRYDSSQDNHGMRGTESAYVSVFIVFIQVFELEYIGELQVSGWVLLGFLFVCLIQRHLIHSHIAVFQGLVLYRLWQKQEYHS